VVLAWAWAAWAVACSAAAVDIINHIVKQAFVKDNISYKSLKKYTYIVNVPRSIAFKIISGSRILQRCSVQEDIWNIPSEIIQRTSSENYERSQEYLDRKPFYHVRPNTVSLRWANSQVHRQGVVWFGVQVQTV
jgi:hypothetical protein